MFIHSLINSKRQNKVFLQHWWKVLICSGESFQTAFAAPRWILLIHLRNKRRLNFHRIHPHIFSLYFTSCSESVYKCLVICSLAQSVPIKNFQTNSEHFFLNLHNHTMKIVFFLYYCWAFLSYSYFKIYIPNV